VCRRSHLARWSRPSANERGATAVEYGLLVTLIAIFIIGAVTLLGGNLSAFFEGVAENPPFG
jgi:pilus assembly protein Flp/PilA